MKSSRGDNSMYRLAEVRNQAGKFQQRRRAEHVRVEGELHSVPLVREPASGRAAYKECRSGN